MEGLCELIAMEKMVKILPKNCNYGEGEKS